MKRSDFGEWGQALFAEMSEPAFVVDIGDELLVEANPQARRWLGFSETGDLALPVWQWIRGVSEVERAALFQAFRSGGNQGNENFPNLRIFKNLAGALRHAVGNHWLNARLRSRPLGPMDQPLSLLIATPEVVDALGNTAKSVFVNPVEVASEWRPRDPGLTVGESAGEKNTGLHPLEQLMGVLQMVGGLHRLVEWDERGTLVQYHRAGDLDGMYAANSQAETWPENWLGRIAIADRPWIKRVYTLAATGRPLVSEREEYHLVFPNGQTRRVRESLRLSRRSEGGTRLESLVCLLPSESNGTTASDDFVMGGSVASEDVSRGDFSGAWPKASIVASCRQAQQGESNQHEDRAELAEKLRRARDELIESNQLLLAILESAPCMISAVDERLRFRMMNEYQARHFGITSTMALGQTQLDLLGAERASSTLAREQLVLDTAVPLSYEETNIDAQGYWHTWWTIKVPLKYPRGAEKTGATKEVFGVATISLDISERKRGEESLRRSEALYYSLMENFPLCVLRKDRELRVIYANQRLRDLIGKEATDILDQRADMSAPLEFAEKYHEHDRRVLETGELVEAIEENRLPGGQTIAVQVIKTPVRDEGGQIEGVQCVFWDITEKLRAEAKLRESQHFSQKLADTLPASLFVFDLFENRVVYTNESAWERFSLGEPGTPVVTLEKLTSLIHPADSVNVMETFMRLRGVADGVILESEFRAHVTPYEWNCYFCRITVFSRNLQGEVREVLGTVLDITDRRAAEEAVSRQREEQRQILDSVQAQVWRLDLDARVLQHNRYAERVTGLAHEEVVGKSLLELAPQFDQPLRRHQESLLVAETGMPLLGSVESANLAGETNWFSIDKIPTFDSDGNVTGLLIFSYDITHVMRVEQQLERSRRQLLFQQEALASLTRSDLFQGDDLDDLLRHITETAARTMGIERVSLWRTAANHSMISCADLFIRSQDRHESGHVLHFENFPSYFAALATNESIVADDARIDPRTCEFTESYLHPLGITAMMDVPVLLFGRLEGVLCHEQVGPPVPWSPEQHLFAVALSNLISLALEQRERRITETALAKAKDAAEAASRAKSDFLANISHEIRTPMNGVQGITELLLRTGLTDQQRHYLHMVKVSSDAMLSLLNDILDFSRIEADKLELEHIRFSLRDTIANTLKLVALRAHTKGIELACRVAPELPDALMGDPGRLRQILLNLLSNGVKFTERGQVVLEVGPQAHAEVSVQPQPQPQAHDQGQDQPQTQTGARRCTLVIQFRVGDTGIGIPPDKLECIFAPFEQADTSQTRRFGGSGLGLAIVARLVTMMRGNIRVTSTLGVGSTFDAILPFACVEENRYPLVVAEHWRDTEILFFAPVSRSRDFLAEGLKSAGFAVEVASDAASAMHYWLTHPSALLVLDAALSPAAAFRFVERCRAEALTAPVVILLPAEVFQSDLERCQQMGLHDLLVKPVLASELVREVVRSLQGDPSATTNPTPVFTMAIDHESLRILVVDDNSINQILTVEWLARDGHVAVAAENGRVALDMIAAQSFDVVLMDIQMPVMDGFEAMSHIRAQERDTNTHLPVIAVTASALNGDRERCLSAGFDEYISKPINMEQLRAQLREVILAKRGAAGEAPSTCTVPKSVVSPMENDSAHAGEILGTRSAVEESYLVTAQPTLVANDHSDHQNAERDTFVALDEETLLERFCGNMELLEDVWKLFQNDVPNMIVTIRDSIAIENRQTAASVVHKLKGSVSNFAYRPCFDAAVTLEHLVRAGNFEEAPDACSLLETEIAHMRLQLEVFISRLKGSGE